MSDDKYSTPDGEDLPGVTDDFSLADAMGVHLRRIAMLAMQGLEDEHRFADAQAAYQKIKEAFDAEFISNLWADAREAERARNIESPLYWLRVFGAEADRRYQRAYRRRPKRKAYLTKYRTENKAKAAKYMREWRAARKGEATL
jgi:hypothetical protein